MNQNKFDIKSLRVKAGAALQKAQRFSLVLFICFIALLYGYVMLRINTLSNTQPTPESVSSQVKAAGLPHIDESVVQQLESLHNNSVNVQALFNDARNNPFQ
jgi:hypothetical protein